MVAALARPFDDAFVVGKLIARRSLVEVYEAEHLGGLGHVWLKVFRATVQEDSEVLATFKSFGEKLKRLVDPGVVRLLEVGVAHGQPYAVYEAPRGRLLTEIKKSGGQFAPFQVIRMLAQLNDTLSYLHRCRAHHGELTPACVLVSDDGEARIDDVGIAELDSILRDRAVRFEAGHDVAALGAIATVLFETNLPEGERPRVLEPKKREITLVPKPSAPPPPRAHTPKPIAPPPQPVAPPPPNLATPVVKAPPPVRIEAPRPPPVRYASVSGFDDEPSLVTFRTPSLSDQLNSLFGAGVRGRSLNIALAAGLAVFLLLLIFTI